MIPLGIIALLLAQSAPRTYIYARQSKPEDFPRAIMQKVQYCDGLEWCRLETTFPLTAPRTILPESFSDEDPVVCGTRIVYGKRQVECSHYSPVLSQEPERVVQPVRKR